MSEKVVLAYSGGLDTSFCVLNLIENGYDVITMTVDTGGLPEEEKEYIEKRSKELGATKHIFVDAQKEIFDEIISYLIKANGLYQGVYPNMCADRYTIGKHLVETTRKEGARIVAHGCTGAGNDQVRIDITILSLDPSLKIITPTRDCGMTRSEEIEYLEKKGFTVPKKAKKYTINENVFGITTSGSEIDRNEEPEEDAWILTKITKNKPEYFEIGFEKGIPVSLNGKIMHGLDILRLLNKEAGAHGYGRGLYIEDEVLGIKGIQAFEAPGLLLLIEAHKALERLTLTRRQLILKENLDNTWADLAFTGLFYEPVMRDIHAFIDNNQTVVTGRVRMKVDTKNAIQVGVFSDNSLIRTDIAEYAQKTSWKAEDAKSFIKLYGMQQRIAAERSKKK